MKDKWNKKEEEEEEEITYWLCQKIKENIYFVMTIWLNILIDYDMILFVITENTSKNIYIYYRMEKFVKISMRFYDCAFRMKIFTVLTSD